MNDTLKLIETRTINDALVNGYYGKKEAWFTRDEIGSVLGYADPRQSIANIHNRHKERFSDKSVQINLICTDGKSYDTKHYNLKAIISVGNKVDSPKAVQFRKWANNVIEEYTIKGFAMDDERLKNGGTVLTKKYFEELLERIREIRLSERKFYQKITDIYATAIDYDSKQKQQEDFFRQFKIRYIMQFMAIQRLK